MLRKEALAQHPDVRKFQAGAWFAIKDIEVRTFSVPHDAVDPIGFTLHHEEEALGFLTDLGKCNNLVRERVKGVSTLVIETNHDEKTLQNDPHRPWALKQRIMSIHGHLSNAAAAAELAGLLEHGLNRAILCHLSRDCNSPELVLAEVRSRFAAAGAGEAVEVYCAMQKEVSPRFAIRRSLKITEPKVS
jgi:phosphoribosyl 1,2-cyclic phosphodiesterase